MGVVEIAKSYIGKVKYKFGADNLDGGEADCSSYTQSVFAKAGFKIGGDTNAQWQNGDPVDKDGLAPGDLVFFHSTYQNDHKDGVSHVGIYTGNGKFVHCGSKGVTEASLDESYWVEHWLGARRIPGASSEGSVESATSTGSSGSKGSEIKLEWWGDIVTVVVAGLLLVGGVVMLVLGVKSGAFTSK